MIIAIISRMYHSRLRTWAAELSRLRSAKAILGMGFVILPMLRWFVCFVRGFVLFLVMWIFGFNLIWFVLDLGLFIVKGASVLSSLLHTSFFIR